MMELWNIGFSKIKFSFIIPLFHYSRFPDEEALGDGVIGTNLCGKI